MKRARFFRLSYWREWLLHPFKMFFMERLLRNHWLIQTGPHHMKAVHYSEIYPTEWRHEDMKNLSVKTLTPAESLAVKFDSLAREAVKSGIPTVQVVEIMRQTALSLQRPDKTGQGIFATFIGDTQTAAEVNSNLIN